MIYQLLSGLFLFVGLAACSEETEGGGDEPEVDPRLEAVTLHIGASETATTRAFGGDENARKGEFMNTLRVFIVDADGMIEKVITAMDSATFKTNLETEGAGCVTNYTTTVDLLPGVKTIYAFANMDNVYRVDETTRTFDDELEALKEGDTWQNLSSYVLSDPAKDINLTTNFIPMSVQQSVDLTVDNQQVSVALVRLVGRVDVVVNNQQGEVTVSKLTLSDFADRVSLFEQTGETKNSPNDTKYNDYVHDFGETGLTIPNATTTPFELDTFYVNETFERTEAFTVSLGLANGTTLSGNTQSWNIERNHILPLQLNLSNLDIILTITAQIAPIGGYPVTVYTDEASLTNNYQITLPEGCTFTISGKLQSSGGINQKVESWLWWIDKEGVTSNDVVVLDGNVTNATSDISGHVTALPEQTATLNFQVYQPNAKNGTLTITTKALKDWDEYETETNALTRWLATPRRYEPIHLTTP